MKKLILKSLFLLSPFLVITGYFVIKDPMKVIHYIDDPTTPGVLMNDRVHQARHLEKHPQRYNAFIFGSSRSKAFKTVNWQKAINEKLTPYHMGVNDESLYGLERKFYLLDSLGYKIDHALILLDHRLLSLHKNHEAHIFTEDYLATGETVTSFYQRFFKAFLDVHFLKQYIAYQRNGKVDNNENLLWDPGFTFNKSTGDIFYSRMDDAIQKDSVAFYTLNKHTFHERSPQTSEVLIDDNAKKIIQKIKRMLDKHHTSYQVILTPNYDQVSIAPKDLVFLERTFSEKRVHASFGVNSITNEIGNYYEHKHFKPYIATRLMHEVYTNIK